MSKPFDATLKDLGADYPIDYLTTFDQIPAGPLRRINVDLSTVTTAGDIVFGVGEPLSEIVHIDFQASADRKKGTDLLVHNALLFRQYEVPVHGILVLLRPQATANIRLCTDRPARQGQRSAAGLRRSQSHA